MGASDSAQLSQPHSGERGVASDSVGGVWDRGLQNHQSLVVGRASRQLHSVSVVTRIIVCSLGVPCGQSVVQKNRRWLNCRRVPLPSRRHRLSIVGCTSLMARRLSLVEGRVQGSGT